MHINPLYLEYYKESIGFNSAKENKAFYDINNVSTEQISFILNYELSNSTMAKLISQLLDQIFNSIDVINSKAINLKAKFMLLMNEWKEDTMHLSSVTDICTHPAYQQIIGMGKPIIELIINELRNSPDHWFWALKSITGEDPVPDNKKGNIKEMTKTWIQWGSNKGI